MTKDSSVTKPSRLIRLAAPLLVAGATIALFDVAAWFLLPSEYTAFSSSYRKTWLLSSTPQGQPAMTRPFPRHYFRADETLGFDINPGARGIEVVDGYSYQVFANRLGCFDRNDLETFQRSPEYHYFAGDSFTWGFARYESKFATVWEGLTGKIAAKCGVTHTGQAHQFEKFKRFVAAVGRQPAEVYVGFYVNDPMNDEAYPHTTIVGGYMVDIAFLKDGALVHPDAGEVTRTVERSIRELEAARPGPVDRLKTAVWVYSLSANIVNQGILAARKGLRHEAPAAGGAAGDARPTAKFGDNLYYWYHSDAVKAGYATDPMFAASRTAIQRWARHARENGYRIVFLLFPPRDNFDDVHFFDQVRGWLDANGIEHLDLARLFNQERLGVDDLYWPGNTNGHWHEDGNRIVGHLLAERLPRAP
jgi:hypothetical protein